MITEEEIDEAIKRIGMTADGELLSIRLQRILQGVEPSGEVGALLGHEGRRSLARDLKAQLEAGLAESGSDGRSGSVERVIVSGRPAVAADTRSRRRVQD